MGRIKSILARVQLPERERHNSRLFVDLAEQAHIHFRELRNQFSVEEFFEYADTVARSAKDLRRYLRWHPEYREQEASDPLMVALGPEQQTRPLRKSPKPHQSAYFPNRLQIELQGEEVIDEVHLHYRDYRLVMNQETFRVFAEAIGGAVEQLDDFLAKHEYERVEHPFRKAVVEDRWHEARQWAGPGRTRIGLAQRVKGILHRIGGKRLVELSESVVRRLKRS